MGEAPNLDATVHAFALRAFPYTRRELNPIDDSDDLKLICAVDGWKDANQLTAFFAERVLKKQPALVVVAGGSGTGRTSLANYLIRMWADARAAARGESFDRTKLVVASGQMSDFAEKEQLWEWVLDLWPQILASGFKPAPATEKAFDDLRQAIPQALAPALRDALMKLTADLATKDIALAGILEDVKKYELLLLARDTFRYLNALLVTTVENTAGNFDAVLSELEDKFVGDEARIVTLGDPQGPDARRVVAQRWRTFSDHDPPFADSVLDAGFGGKARPMVRVLRLAEALFLDKQIEFKERSEQWPAADYLVFKEPWVRDKISLFDRLLGPGR